MRRFLNTPHNLKAFSLTLSVVAIGSFAGCPQPQTTEPPPPENIWDLGDVVWAQTGGEEPPYTLTVDSAFRNDILNNIRQAPVTVTGNNITDGTVTSADLDPTTVNNVSNTTIQQLNSSTSTGLLDGSAIRDATLRASAFVANMFSTQSVDQGGLPDGSIHGSKLIDGTVTAAKLSFSVAPGGTLMPGSVGATEIGDGAVGTSELADGSVTAPKLAPTLFAEGSAAVQLAPGTIHGSKLAAGTVNGDRLVNASVSSGQINMADLIAALQASALFGGVPVDSIPPGAIQPGITGAQIADGSLTGTDMQDGSLTGADLAADTITATQIAANAIGSSELADNSVDSAAIIDGQVRTADLFDGAVTSSKLADGAVTTAKIADNAITGAKIANGSVDIPDLTQAVVDRLLPPNPVFGDITAVRTPASSGLLGGVENGDAALSVNPTLTLGQTPPAPSFVHLFNGALATPTVYLDSTDANGFGAELTLTRGNGDYGIVLDSQGNEAGGPARFYMAQPGNQNTMFLESGTATAPGASVHLFNGRSPNRETIALASNSNGFGPEITLSHHTGVWGVQTGIAGGAGGGYLQIYNDAGLYGIVAEARGAGSGRVTLYNGGMNNPECVRLESDAAVGSGVVRLFNSDLDGDGPLAVEETITLAGTTTGSNAGGEITLRNGSSPNSDTIQLEGNGPFGGGYLRVNGPDGSRRGEFWAGNGANVPYSSLRLFSASNDLRLNFEAGYAANDVGGNFSANNAAGRVTLACNAGGPVSGSTFNMYRGDEANGLGLRLHGEGRMYLLNTDGVETVALKNGGIDSASGVIELTQGSGRPGLVLNANTGAGGGGIYLSNNGGTQQILIQADDPAFPENDHALIAVTGKIRATYLCGELNVPGPCADVAESFEHSESAVVQPGMVMVIDPENPGKLTVSTAAYDKRVAGIISGAGDLKPGVSLGQRADGSTDNPLALAGRVYCYVDATEHAVEVGDMLTTSDTPGHAMKAADPSRAFGCVLGKAMQPLAKGEKGLVLVLVSLQ